MIAKLGDIAEFTNGGAWSDREYTETGIPVVKVTNLKNGTVDLTEINYIPESSLDKYGRHLLRKGDLVIATVGSHPNLVASAAGRATIIPSIAEGALLNQNALCLRTNSEILHQGYLGYLGKSDLFQGYVKSVGRGAANQVRIALGLIKEFSFDLPPLPTQRKIANILSAYDDLIENNLKRIKLLEEKAFLRYKQIAKEEKLEKHTLSDFGDIITGKTPSTTIADYFGDDVPFIKTPDMHNQIFIEHTDQMLSELGAKSQEKKFLPPLSLCVSCIGTAGVIGITSKPSQTNQQINSIVFDEPKNVYFFYALMSQMKEQLDALGSNGSTFTNVNKNKFENMEVFVPNQKTLNEFAEEFEDLFKLILTLQKRNNKLREARDILLPRLMSGQIEV
ncbi:restriction endonuclease subunit S [Lacihabitans sp. LS3-19]|uniref:restriction endonuclease subunit S n=1 Tax=Lacihabitans sp. LS3-19 TaxID=2487335 RepID=UPI0020CF4731|nr:restriction endonuclease subunit S [Lacihabitans sp. LS3-19]MCP9769438.1 restriction endonuclease subunit S [Lacihabitans sp. LS3-19]